MTDTSALRAQHDNCVDAIEGVRAMFTASEIETAQPTDEHGLLKLATDSLDKIRGYDLLFDQNADSVAVALIYAALWKAYHVGKRMGVIEMAPLAFSGVGVRECQLTEESRLDDEFYCQNHCPQERHEGEDCALNGGCPLVRKV